MMDFFSFMHHCLLAQDQVPKYYSLLKIFVWGASSSHISKSTACYFPLNYSNGLSDQEEECFKEHQNSPPKNPRRPQQIRVVDGCVFRYVYVYIICEAIWYTFKRWHL